MHEPWFYAVWTLGAYLLGSVSVGHLVGRAAGVDITALGTGNPGAANVFREVGPVFGVMALVLDATKGAAVTVPLYLLALPLWAALLATSALLAAHFYPIVLRFPSGTGMAAGMGATFGVLPFGALVAAPAAALAIGVTRSSGHSGGLFFGVTVLVGGLVHRDPWGAVIVLLIGLAISVRAWFQYRGR